MMVGPSLFRVSLPMPIQPQASIKLVPHKPAHGGQRGGGIKLVPHKPAHGGQRGGGIKLVPHKPAHGGQRASGLLPHGIITKLKLKIDLWSELPILAKFVSHIQIFK